MKRHTVWATGGVVALALGTTIVYSASPKHATPSPSQASIQPHTATKPAVRIASDAYPEMAAPQTLRIPSLSIKSTVRPVGTTPDGAMDIPDSLTDTGWFNQSAHPGNPGRAVLAVHTGYPNKPSQFRDLERLQPGASIEVQDTTGATASFSVIQVARYEPDKAPINTIFGSSPTSRLNIITCTGAWDPARNSYKERLVIFAARSK